MSYYFVNTPLEIENIHQLSDLVFKGMIFFGWQNDGGIVHASSESRPERNLCLHLPSGAWSAREKHDLVSTLVQERLETQEWSEPILLLGAHPAQLERSLDQKTYVIHRWISKNVLNYWVWGWFVISTCVAIIEIKEDREGDGKLGQIRLTGQVRSGLRTDNENLTTWKLPATPKSSFFECWGDRFDRVWGKEGLRRTIVQTPRGKGEGWIGRFELTCIAFMIRSVYNRWPREPTV